MKHDWKAFTDDIAGLLKTTGASGATGATPAKPLNAHHSAGPNQREQLAPVDLDWGHPFAATGASHHTENVRDFAPGPNGPSGPTQFAEGSSGNNEAEQAARSAHIPDGWREGYRVLREASPHDDFNPIVWAEMLVDGAAFLREWGDKAVSLGWSDCDVFGVHPVKPAARVGCWGLALLIQGGKVFAITDNSATLRRQSGAVLVWRRGFGEQHVPLWKLVKDVVS